MKRTIPFLVVALAASTLLAADSSPKEEITAAAKKLGEKANYSWRTTVVVPEDAQFKPGPTEGKTEKDGITHVTMTFGDNTSQFFVKGDKAVMTNQDGDWQSLAEMENEEGMGRFFAVMVRNYRTPADQAIELVSSAKELKKEGEAYVGDLTEEGAKNLIRFRRGGDGPAISNAKGSVKFWIKDGQLSKYEYKVSGKMTFNDNDFDVDRTTTTEIKEVGTTKVSVPEAAKKKMT